MLDVDIVVLQDLKVWVGVDWELQEASEPSTLSPLLSKL
jgi:hypothetical protein